MTLSSIAMHFSPHVTSLDFHFLGSYYPLVKCPYSWHERISYGECPLCYGNGQTGLATKLRDLSPGRVLGSVPWTAADQSLRLIIAGNW